MSVYRTKGVLTGTIEPDNVSKAQEYLREDMMAMYVAENADLVGVLEWITWDLDSDGHHWSVTAVTTRELSNDELKRLSSEVSGQNSDGLGEGFEQQDFAETQGESEEDCGDCNGRGWTGELDDDGDEVQVDCERCDGAGILEREDYGMISFDWQTNPCTFEQVK